jgi:lipopolysaccharide/colanic/teichoic acid biosynthesis glycosyltransferase
MQQANWDANTTHIRVAAFCNVAKTEVLDQLSSYFQVTSTNSLREFEVYMLNQSLLTLPDIVLMEIDEHGKCFDLIEKIKRDAMLKGIIIVLLATTLNKEWLQKAKQFKVHDYYTSPFPIKDIADRLIFLVKFKLIKPSITELSEQVETTYRMPVVKRLFDIVFSGVLLLILSPLMLVVALLIKMGSKGPVIYKSKRVGTGYKVFDFYKFRSMRPDADKKLAELAAMNQYANTEGQTATFVKFKNDPRITRLGHFIRRSSIDELPQLFNILKGDMSTVGNRPLPLYEAEMLTSHEWAWRFIAPAGLTGLWQISRRGKEEMSERERKKLDNFYAKNYSVWLDIKILVGTIPAVFQKENV